MNNKNGIRKNKLMIAIGAVNILIGLFCLLCALGELPAFKLFSEGSFAYEGFGFGSFMFAFLVFWIYFYLVCAIIFTLLGVGFIRHDWWAWKVMRVLLALWTGIGLTFLINTGLLFTDLFNNYSSIRDKIPQSHSNDTIIIFLLIAIIFFVVPGIYLLVLRNRKLINALKTDGFVNDWLARYPSGIIGLVLIYISIALFLSFLFFYKSIFPFMGVLLKGTPGALAIIVTISILVFVIINTLKLKPWSWWLSVIFFSLTTASAIYTLSLYTFFDIYKFIGFPKKEMEILEGFYMFKGFKVSVLVGLPLVYVLFLLGQSKRYFKDAKRQASDMLDIQNELADPELKKALKESQKQHKLGDVGTEEDVFKILRDKDTK